MNIYKVSRKDHIEYDQYYSFVCYAKDEEAAKEMLPEPTTMDKSDKRYECYVNNDWTTNLSDISVEYVGMCLDVEKEGVILASYKAG